MASTLVPKMIIKPVGVSFGELVIKQVVTPLLRIICVGVLGASFSCDLNVLCLDFFLVAPIFPPMICFTVGFRNLRILTLMSQKSEQQFFPGRVAYAGLVFLNGEVNFIENHLWVDLQLGFMMEFRSSARKQSWNGVRSLHKRGYRSGSGTRSVVIIQWEVYHGGRVGSLEVKSVPKISQTQL